MRKIVVIGGVAAGSSAASKAKRIDPDADVKIIQDESVVSYGACGMPYVIEGIINNFGELIERSTDIFKNQYHIDVIVNTRAHKIDRLKKQVYATDLKSSKEITFDYDSLVIATGARAVIPNIKGVDNKCVFLIRNYGDGVRISDSIKNAYSCVIAGAGLIGLEMAESFKKRNTKTTMTSTRRGRNDMDVTVVELSDHILPTLLDKDMANIVQQELQDNGVKVILGERVQEIVSSNARNRQVEYVETTAKRKIDADFVLLGTGVRPNSEIAAYTGIELGYANAIRVDDYMRTNIPDIFAAGDCATSKNYITNKDTYLPLGTTANKQGRVAGENAAGGNAKFRGIAGSAITKVFDLFIGKTGLTRDEALKYGFEDTIEEEIESITRAGYYPDTKPIWIKIVADRKTKRVLGSQIVGGEAVKERIDLISLALLLKADITDLATYDACYVPPASPVWEPINVAASQLAKKLLL
ncbi:MAG TPA: FAD-dependent oxidoreductase [Nitrososphaeraceae archaeon]|nr:FAD-dependent oxidoreductase [Nitrososphaeraceae archaeon]